MGYNKIPLALRYNDTTNNAEGLIEFQLNLSDVGDVCGDEPGTGQALVRNASGDWCPSTLPAPGSFNGNLSDVGQVCSATPTNGQVLAWSGAANVWCASTIVGGGGGGAVNSVNDLTGDVSLYLSSLSGVDTSDLQADHHIVYDDATNNWVSQYSQKLFLIASNQTGVNLSKGAVVYVSGATPGADPEIALALADSSATMPSIGVIYETISDTSTGPVITFGTAIGLTFDDALTAGDIGKTVYVSPTNAGQVTITKPTGSTHLIQNVGVLVDYSPVKVKVTGVGRANDIPINVDVVGSATIGTNEFTQTTAKLAGTTANEIVITDPTTNLINSVASATLLSNYYTQAQADAAFLEDSTSSINPPNLSGTITNGQLIKRSSPTQFAGVTTTTNSETFLGTDANLGDLTDVSVESAAAGQALVRSGENNWIASTLDTGAGFVDGPTVSATFSSIEVDDIKVNRLLESRPTCITHFSDWLSLDVRNNGYSPSLYAGGSHVQDSSLVTMNTTEYGIGVTRLKSGTTSNAQSRIMTYDSAVAPSTCGISFAARVCPSGAWTSGTNEGVITMGLHNRSNTANLHPNAGAWFQYDHSSSKWQAITAWFTVSSNTVTTVDATPESFQVLQIMIDENWQTFEFYIDGNNVATHLISTHNVPTSRRYGFTFSVRNGSLAGPASFTTVGNELFLDWDYRKLTHTATDRGESYIKKTLSGE